MPIPGTRRLERLEEIVAAASITLTVEERALLEATIPVGAAVGDRCPEGGILAVNR